MSDPTSQPPQKSPSGRVKAPNSLCALQIVTGATTLALAAMVLLFPATAVFVIVFWLSISLLFGGIDDMIIGIGATHMSRGWRAVSIIIGGIAIALSIAVLAFPGAAVMTSVVLVSIALLFLGAGGIARGISEKRIPGWARGMLIAVGAITVGLALPVLIFPEFGLSVLYAFLAAALIVNGVSYIVAGAIGIIFSPISLGRTARRFWESDAA